MEITATIHPDSQVIDDPVVPAFHASLVRNMLEIPEEPYRAEHCRATAGRPDLLYVIRFQSM